MSKLGSQFPEYIVLNGADCFLLQVDRMMLKANGRSNVCTFVVSLDKRLEIEELEQCLSDNPAYQWISRLRIQQGLPFMLPKWVFDKNLPAPTIKQFQNTEYKNVPETLLATKINAESESPFKIDLVRLSESKSLLVFTWHHVLMDAHGGEAFIYALGLKQSFNNNELLKDVLPQLPLKQRADIAKEIKSFLYDTLQLPILSLYRKKKWFDKPITTLRYQVITFTEQDSLQISQNARQQGASFLLSAFYLAATACSVAAIQKQRTNEQDDDAVIPIPLDTRKRGEDTPILGNQVTFLFYRIPQSVLSDVQACTAELISQMKELMRTDSPKNYLVMMDFLRRIPGFFYRLMLKIPTKGLMASFFYSDTGETLQNYVQLFGRPIKSAIHYPPVTHPPGMTFIYSRFRGCLQITFGYMEEVINDQEVDQLLDHLKVTLVGVKTNG